MRNFDFSSWQSIMTTLIGLALFTLISMGIRLLMMFTIQRRRERFNRQINERLRSLIAAYKTLGGSFTGDLTVNPAHRRDTSYRVEAEQTQDPEVGTAAINDESDSAWDRPRRIRDAVEATLSDIILLGTEEQVRLAERAVRDLVAGRLVHTHDLVISLRDFIREALDLAPIPSDLQIPAQGPARPSSSGGRGGKGEKGGDGSRGSGGGGGGMGGGMGSGFGSEGTADHNSTDPKVG